MRGVIIAGLLAVLVGFIAHQQVTEERVCWAELQRQAGFAVKPPRLWMGYQLYDARVVNDGGKGGPEFELTYYSRAAVIRVTETTAENASLTPISAPDQPVEVHPVTVGGQTLPLYVVPGTSQHRIPHDLITVRGQGITYMLEGDNTSPDEILAVAQSLVE